MLKVISEIHLEEIFLKLHDYSLASLKITLILRSRWTNISSPLLNLNVLPVGSSSCEKLYLAPPESTCKVVKRNHLSNQKY